MGSTSLSTGQEGGREPVGQASGHKWQNESAPIATSDVERRRRRCFDHRLDPGDGGDPRRRTGVPRRCTGADALRTRPRRRARPARGERSRLARGRGANLGHTGETPLASGGGSRRHFSLLPRPFRRQRRIVVTCTEPVALIVSLTATAVTGGDAYRITTFSDGDTETPDTKSTYADTRARPRRNT